MRKEIDIRSKVRENLRDLVPYSSARTEHGFNDSIFLDANENPYPTGYNRYPDPLQGKLKKAISQLKGVDESCIFLGNGSDEPIDLLIRLFCTPGRDSILIPDPTYGMYGISAGINDIRVKKVPFNPDFSLNPDQFFKSLDNSVKLIFLCSPNNPTGNALDTGHILELLEKFDGMVVVDEAYIDFSSQESLLKNIYSYDNLVILQTLSKAWGLAGLRVGMCFSNPQVTSFLNKIKPPYNIPGPSQKIAFEALGNILGFEKMVQEISKERQKLEINLGKLNFVEEVFPSDANFLLVRFRESRSVYDYLKSHEMMVRDRSHETHCANCLRISVGTPEENKKLIQLLNLFES